MTRDTWQGDYNRPLSLNRWLYGYGNPIKYTDPSGKNPYYRFDRTISFIYTEMVSNSKGYEANLMKELLNNNGCVTLPINLSSFPELSNVGSPLLAYAYFAIKAKPNSDWDHKPKIKALLQLSGSEQDEYYPIRGEESYSGQHFEYYYDIWSNIHYGYVGAAIGINQKALLEVQGFAKYFPSGPFKDWLEKGLGEYDRSDDISVQIGLNLWNKYHMAITPNLILVEILQNRHKYLNVQDLNANGIIDKPEVHPRKGKLLPEGMKRGGVIIGDWK